MTQCREVVKGGWLQERVVINKLLGKKIVDRPALWYTLCVHDDRVPFLEAYNSEQETSKHRPVLVQDLLYCNHLCPCIDENSLSIGLENRVLTLVAFTRQERQDWLDLIKFKLEQLKLVESSSANLYSPLPTPPVAGTSPGLSVSSPDPRRLSVFGSRQHDQPLIDLQPPPVIAPLPPAQTDAQNTDTGEQERTVYAVVTSARRTNAPISSPIQIPDEPTPISPQPPPIPPRSPLVKDFKSPPKKMSLDSVIPAPTSNYFSFPQSRPDNNANLMTYDTLPSSPPNRRMYDPVPDEPDAGLDFEMPAAQQAHSPDNYCNSTRRTSDACNNFMNQEAAYYGTLAGPSAFGDVSGYSTVGNISRPVPIQKLSQEENGAMEQQIIGSFDRLSMQPADNCVDIPKKTDSNLHVTACSLSPTRSPIPLSPTPPTSALPSPPPPPLPPRNTQKKSMIETEVDTIQAQIRSNIEIIVQVPLHDVAGHMALVQFENSVWIAGWTSDVHRRLSAALKFGDRLCSVNGSPVSNVDQTNLIINAAVPGKSVKLGINRMPYGQVFLLTREADDEPMGIELKHNKNSIENVVSGSPSAKAGMTVNCDKFQCPWVVTAINGRYVSILSTDNGASEKLNGRGRQMSVVVQPKSFIKSLISQLKLIKNYKLYQYG